jgi:hypothetical protein
VVARFSEAFELCDILVHKLEDGAS